MKAEAERDEGDGGHGGQSVPTPSRTHLGAQARAILEAAWRSEDDDRGFCVPHAVTYPWQWLWDSCFHAVVWTHLGDARAVAELRAALGAQDADGFVPHLRYVGGPEPHRDLWGRPATSSITQPPMYGHAIATVQRAGADLDDELVERGVAGLRFLLERRRRSAAGLVELCHPWESGCDDSPRWDGVLSEAWTPARWYDAKGALVATIERSGAGAPLHNPAFAVGSVGFSALVAWNARELAGVTGDDGLRAAGDDLAAAIDARWDAEALTWVDDGPTRSAGVRTLDALLPALVCPRPAALAQLRDPSAFHAPFGPRGLHRAEPAYEPDRYWRGSAWPQLTYLLWVASGAVGDHDTSAALSRSFVAGAAATGFAEHWNPETAAPLGAVPQSWTTLASVVAADTSLTAGREGS